MSLAAYLGRWLTLVLCLALGACATGPMANPADPLEPLNRAIYSFNDTVDRAVLKPVATVYRDATPSLVRRGVGNFFGNLEDVWSFVNNVLQFKGEAAASSFMRVSVNTVFGFAGLLDVASEMRIERFTEDFGQTLGHWGVSPGPYLVLPLLGPSNLRDTAALPVDWRGDAVLYVKEEPVRYSLIGLRVVDQRAELLRAGTILDQVALDKYSFIRDAYLQRRRNLVYDGNPPEEDWQEEAAPR